MQVWLLLFVLPLATDAAKRQSGFGCCTPKLWKSEIRTLRMFVSHDGTTHRQQIWQTLNYDANNQKVSVATSKENDRDVSLREVLDYNQHARYLIEKRDNQEKCSRFQLTRPFEPACVENTTSVYFARVGDSPANPGGPGLWENTAYFSHDDVTGYATVTLVDCALVAEVIFGDFGREMMSQNVQYMNQTINAVDPAAFNIPSDCPPRDTEKMAEPWQQYSVLGRLI